MYLHPRNTLLVLITLVSVPTPSMAGESVLKAGNGRVCKTEKIVIDQKEREVYFVCDVGNV